MARYIDADKVLDKMMFEMAGTGHQARAMAVIRYAETADVVPKSEVERLKAEKDALIKNYAECMKEVAREIFEEIEDVINNIGYFDEIDFNSLKKKYTESEDKV